MPLTLLGVIVIFIPFLLIFSFKNRLFGFLSVLVGITIFHLFLSLFTQYFHFFSYPIILAVNLTLDTVILGWLIINRQQVSFKIKINYLALAAFLIIFFELWSVHYFYTGLVNTINGNQSFQHQSYLYPYFSDEWAGVAFTNYSIKNQALPTVNPIINGSGRENFPNIFIGFFAGLAEIFLLLNLSPLLGFPVLAIITGLLICLLIYLLLKSIKVNDFSALFGALCLPWIVNSINLPGLWYLLPFVGGSIFFLVSLISLSLKKQWLAIISGGISLFLYPSLVVLIIPALIIDFLISSRWPLKKKIFIISICLIFVVLVAGLILITQIDSWPALADLFFNSLIRANNDGCIPIRAIWQIIPFALLPLAALGIFKIYQKKIFYLLAPILISLTFWLVYAYCPYFLIIDYARIAVISSFLLMVAVGLGFDYLTYWLETKYSILNQPQIKLALKILIIFLFLVLAFFYTSRTAWTKIVLRYETAQGVFKMPTSSPVNNYLNEDDLRLFSGLSGQRFLTIPWKALVIASATGNYPPDSKASIITNNNPLARYDLFMNSNCDYKDFIAKQTSLSYVYTKRFNCPNFLELGSSREDLYLYKYQP